MTRGRSVARSNLSEKAREKLTCDAAAAPGAREGCQRTSRRTQSFPHREASAAGPGQCPLRSILCGGAQEVLTGGWQRADTFSRN